MRYKFMAVALAVTLGVASAGCMTPSGYYDPQASAAGGMVGGAATGAALGAIIGAATGNPGAGAWIGAASGAGAGALAGSIYAREQNVARAQAAQGPPPQGYDPSLGNIFAIDQANVDPQRVQPGGQVMLTMNYRVMTPQNLAVPVNLVQEIRKDGQPIDQPYQQSQQVRNGSYVARVAYSLPASAARGGYVVTFRIMSSLGTMEKTVYFSVQ